MSFPLLHYSTCKDYTRLSKLDCIAVIVMLNCAAVEIWTGNKYYTLQ